MAENDSYFLNLGSVTQAHKAQKYLEQKGVSATVGKVPSRERGCSYGIHVKGRKKEDILLLLRASSFKIL